MYDHDQLRAWDAQIAEEVFGLVPCQAECHEEGARHYMPGPCHAQPDSVAYGAETQGYTTSDGSAHEVIDQLRERFRLRAVLKNWRTNEHWMVTFLDKRGHGATITDRGFAVTVGRAALEAVRESRGQPPGARPCEG